MKVRIPPKGLATVFQRMASSGRLERPPRRPMYVPVHAPAAAREAIALAASRPWRLVELSLIDLPDA